MKQLKYNTLSDKELRGLCQRPKMDFKSVFEQVQPIIDDVATEGDDAVSHYTKKFDGVVPYPLVINPQGIKTSLSEEVKQAIDIAFKNIYRFHKAQLPMPLDVETMTGIRCQRIARPIERVGLYVPGGTAFLPSTLMMLGVPAALAGCKEIVIATPPKSNGSVADELIYIAQKIGASALLKAGGAQAVAALAWGTDTVSKVDKIFGPGNQYVTAAKMILQNSEAQISIDLPAGPSEVLVIADDTANPEFVAADLLSQAEHGADSQVVLIATSSFNWKAFNSALDQQLNNLPRREIAKESIGKSFGMEVDTLEEAFAFSNRYAPEHLIVQCEEPETWKEHVYNAGSVFWGPWSPESVGDYASGTNHTLPTYGYARMYSGVSVDSFYKFITMQQLTKEGLRKIGPTVETLAGLEGLEGHRQAVSIRLNVLSSREDSSSRD